MMAWAYFGAGVFSIDTTSYTLPLRELGMITDAVWLPKKKK
jgi:hypothetical protein